MNELTNKWGPYQIKQFSPVNISTYILYPLQNMLIIHYASANISEYIGEVVVTNILHNNDHPPSSSSITNNSGMQA